MFFQNPAFSIKNGGNTSKQGRAATLARNPIFRHPPKPHRKAAQTRHAALGYTSSHQRRKTRQRAKKPS